MESLKSRAYGLLRRSEGFFKTDMIYLAKGGFWLTGMQFLTSIGSFLLAMTFARYVDRETYGNYRYILSLAGLAATISITGISAAITQSVARKFYGTFIHAVRVYARWNSLIFLFSATLAAYYFHQGNTILFAGMAVVALFYPLIRTFEIYEAFLNGAQDFRRSALYRGVVDIGTIIATGAAIFFVDSAAALIATNLAAQLILDFIFFKKIYRSIPESEKHNIEEGIVSFSYHLSFQNVLTNLAAQLDKIILFHYLGATELAVYSFAIALPQQIRGYVANVALLATPKISNQRVKEAVKMLPHRFFMSLLFLGPIVLLYIIFAPLLFKIFFPAYVESVPYSQLYALILLIMGNFSDIVLTTQKAVKEKYLLSMIGPSLQIGLMFVLVHSYGIYGIIVAILLTKYLMAAVSYLLARRLPENPV